MKILSCVPYRYYGHDSTVTYEYLSFTEVLRKMGHLVDFFDYIGQCQINHEGMNDFFLSIVKGGGYDLVIVMIHSDEFIPNVLEEAQRYSVLMAWNCDDDWRWADYSSRWYPYYTYMVTTYRHIYEANKKQYPNLLLSQWGCTGLDEGLGLEKDIEISFVGLVYGERGKQIAILQKHLPLVRYGAGETPPQTLRQRLLRKLPARVRISRQRPDCTLKDQTAVKAIWNRSKISFTPLRASQGSGLQIKARVFDMGLSGTVMLCDKYPALYEFYEPGKEYVEFESMEECVDKARYLLAHKSERQGIARAYYARTKAEHLWIYRFEKLFKQMGLST